MLAYHRIHPHIRAVMEETGVPIPVEAVRQKARAILRKYQAAFGDECPVNLEALASFRGLKSSTEHPHHSKDSEIAPDERGRVILRVNRDRPMTRQRFSIGHEIGHTLFPEYKNRVSCRKAIDADWADPSDQLETLCDVAASEFLFPIDPFSRRIADMPLSAASVVALAGDYAASRDATIRRLVELHHQPLAAVFLSWKLKPIEHKQRLADRNQQPMFADIGLPEPERKLRVDYAILNESFEAIYCDRIPAHKSVPCDGPIREAAFNHEPTDGSLWLDLGTAARDFTVHAVPVYTPQELIAPDGAGSVVMLLRTV